MVKEIIYRGKRYIISNESKVAFTAKEWNDGKERYGKIVAEKITEKALNS